MQVSRGIAVVAVTLLAACGAPSDPVGSSDSALDAGHVVYVDYTHGTGVALRAGPSVNETLLQVVPEGAHVLVTGADSGGYTPVTYEGTNGWVHTEFLDAADRGGTVLDVPLVAQNPELPRGCEVTSLTMLLRYEGEAVDKMDLAAEIEKTNFWRGNGLHGNPNDAFVGDMYSFANAGYGVYHAPIARLAEHHAPKRVHDLTGKSLDEVLSNIDAKRPVWVVANALFRPLDAWEFETWQTPSDNVAITWQEHSVLVVGYDARHVFINDPLDANGKTKPLDREAFRGAWEQMGRQAVVVDR